MILLLGQYMAIKKYLNTEVNLDTSDIKFYPNVELHYTHYYICIEQIKFDKPDIISTQNKEFLELLLKSDLDFTVITAYDVNNTLYKRVLSKKDAYNLYFNMNLELR